MNDKILNIISKFLPKFTNIIYDLKYQEKGMFNTELLLICSFISHYNIKKVIESGVKNGQSTEAIARYGVDKLISIDIAKDENNFKNTIERLKNFNCIEFINGDSILLIPKILKKISSDVGVIIDGPKNIAACELGKISFKNDFVKFVAIHDQKNHLMSKYFDNVIYSDNGIFRKKFGYLDDEIMKITNNKYLNGPTIGIAYKNNDDL